MNDKLQQLYDLYKQKGIISTTDFNTFASASDDQRQKLYDLGVQKGLFNTTDYNTFNTAWGGQEPVKKKESTVLESKSAKPTSGSSSRRFEGVTEEPVSQKKVRTDDYIDQVQNAKTQPKQTKTVVANTFVPNATEQTVDVLTTDEANKMMAEDFGKKEFELYSKISDIDKNVFEQGETEAVKYLNNQFKGSGFVFEETGTGNAVRIKSTLNDGFGTVVNEKVVELPTTLFPTMGAQKSKAAEQSMKEISDFMNQAFLKKSEKEFLNEDVKDYGQLVKLAVTNPQKYGDSFLNQYDTERWIDKQYMGLVTEGKSIKREQQLLEQETKAYQESGVFNEETERMLRGRAANLQNQVTANTQKYEEMKDITAKLPQAAAVYFQKKEKEGNLAGLVSGSLLGGLLNMEKMLITTAADVAPLILPSTVMIPEVQQVRLKAAGMTDAQIKDYAAKQLRKGIVKEALQGVDDFVSLGTTDEYIQSKDRNDLEKVVNFLGESVGTAISAGGNPALQSLAFFSQSYNAMEEEMNSPEFDGLTQMEKKLMSVPYGLVIGQLDKLGFNIATNVAKSPLLNKLITNTIARAFTSLPKNASVDVMEKAIEESVKATMAKTGLEIAGGSLVEGTTEGVQSLAEYTMKNLYNNVVADKDVFQNVPDITTKKGFKKAVSAAGEEFYYGSLGGLIMGAGGTAVRSISNGFDKGEKEFDFFEKVINDPNLRSLIKTDIKTKITSGELTKAEAYEQIDAINKSVSILNSMPSDLPVESKREAYNLILERNKIEKQIEGKDPNLVAAQTERVKNINEQLKGLSYAVQKQGADAVPVQSGAGVGTEMEEGKPATKPQVVTGETITEEVEVEGTKAEQPQAEVAQEEVVSEEVPAVEDNSFVYKMNTEKTSRGKGKWEDDFEIIDNRNGLELGEEASKWAVVNKVTGETVEAKSKKDAQDIIKNAPAYGDMFGEGMTVDFTELNEQVQNNYREQFNQQKTKAQAEVAKPTAQAQPSAKIETIEVQEVPQVEQTLDDLTQQNNVITQNDFTAARIRNVGKEKVVAQIAKAAKAIAKVLPKVKIVVHATPEAFVEATKDMDGRLSEGGLYDQQTGEIHINLERANNRTVAHEVFHALILSMVKSDVEAQKLTRSMIRSVLKSLKKAEGTAELISYLEDFESNYDENIKNEEKLGELFAVLADNYKQLPPASKNVIIRFLNRLAKALGLKEMTDREAIAFMNTLSRKVETGQEIEAREVGKQKEGKAAVRKQIIGEVGAKRLDQEENTTLRMDNLEVAKRMKDAGRTPKEIRNLTEWELGAEGKWRYETVDNIPLFKDVVRFVQQLLAENKDGKIVSQKANYFLPQELLNMYPELNDYSISFTKGNENEGKIDFDNKTIEVGVGVYPKNTVSTLLHEIQHAIQEIEGFDSGTNAQKIMDNFLAKDNALKNRINRIKKNSPDSPLLDAVRKERKAFIDNFSTVNKNNERVLDKFNLYMRKAGEIEARNVEARMNMTAEERRNTLLTETEDIKDRQIIEDRNTRKFAVRKQKADVVKSKINEDWDHVITLNGKEIGKIFYDKSQKTWNNSDFYRGDVKPNTVQWVYGDVVGENKQEAIDEMVRRYKEKESKPIIEAKQAKIKYTNDQVTNSFLNALNEKENVSRNPIDNRSFIYGDKASLEFSRFDKGDRNEIAIQSISTFDKGKGVGKQVMKDITDTADELGVTLTLDAKPFGNEGLSKEQLINFYKNNGFVADIEEMFGGEFESEEELIDYVINEEPETALQMTRKPSTRQFAVRKQKLAPNGKPSNLNNQQWEQVRTPEFKAWFGDWENNPENASKVVDENGEPLVVSHFTDQKFDVFKYKEGGFHFGDASLKDDLEIAKGKKLPIELKVFLNIKSPLRIEDSPRFFAEDILKQLERESEYLLNDETIDKLYDKFEDIEDGNSQDPETKKSNELIKEVEKLGIDGYIYENKFDSQDSKSSYIIDEKNSKIYMRNDGVVVVGNVKKLEGSNARPFITFASKSGSEYYSEKNEADEINESDKKRIKELIDDGNIIYTINSPKTSSDFELFTGAQQFNDSYIAFQANQIKSATENVGTFSEREFSIRKQKTTGPDKIVNDGTKAGKTDAEIRQEGKAAGFTNKEMTEALSKYYTKEQKVFMKSGVKGLVGRFVDGARRFKQQFLTSKGLLPKIGFTYKEKMEGEISAEANRAAKTAKKFGVLFDKFTGDKKLLKDAFDKALRGDKSIQLPAGFAALANEMRNHIDRLSQMLIATGAVEGDMADTIRDNMGTYITRSYEIFDNKNFRQKVGEQELQAAKNFLRTQPGMIALAQSEAARTGTTVDEALDVLVDNKIDEYFADAETGALVKGSKLGSKDLSTLKERKEIPEQIRMLMGEYSDPAMNYARTVLNIASLAARHQFLTQVKEAGMGKFFFEKNDSQRPKGFDTEIAAEGSDTMSPLNGLMTTPEIAEAFGLYNGQQGEDSWYSQLSRIYYKAMALVKWLKTIASVGTHMKNIYGNFAFVGVNGHSLVEIGKAIKVVAQDLKTMSKPEVEAKIDEYIKAGIMRQGAGINEIKDMFKDADMDDFLERRLSMKKPKGVMGKIKQAISSKSSKLKAAMEDLYQAEDDMFKIAAYETEMNRYADALYNKSKDQLTDKERQEVSDIAANNVKNTYPTYSRIPEGIKRLRRFPLFIGSFISFQAESYRTAYNTIALAKDELSSDNKKIKAIAARRIAGASAYLTTKTALLSYLGYAAGTGIGGAIGALFDDDDEKEKKKDVISFLPSWSKNSDIIVLKAADGEIEYIDFSASDPHGGINKALNAFFNGEDMLDSFKQSTLELVGQFQGPDILTNLAIQLKGNENDFGKPIYNEEDTFAEKTDKILDYVYKVVEPGTITSVRKAVGSEQSAGQLAFGEATGLKIRKVNIKEQFGYKLPEFDESFKDIRKIYNSEYYKNERLLEDSKATNKDINEQQKKTDDAYVRANEQYAAKAKELMDLINSANRLGIDYDELIDQLESIKSTMGKSNIYEMEDGGTEFIKEK